MNIKARGKMTLSGPKATRRVYWALLIVLALTPLLPFSNYVGHPHWDIVRWIPFQDFSLSWNKLKDIIGNILWFMMFGYFLHYQLNKDSVSFKTIAMITFIGTGVSLSIEFFQVFCHNRTPSVTDVICNVLGAGLGSYVAHKQYAATVTESWPATWLSKVGQNDLISPPVQEESAAGAK